MKNEKLYKFICKKSMNNAFDAIQELATCIAATEISEKIWDSIDQIMNIMKEYDKSLYEDKK